MKRGVHIGIFLKKNSASKVDELVVCAVNTAEVSNMGIPAVRIKMDRALPNAQLKAAAMNFIAGYIGSLPTNARQQLVSIRHKSHSHSHSPSSAYGAGGRRTARVQDPDPVTEEVRSAVIEICEGLGIDESSVQPLRGRNGALDLGAIFLERISIPFLDAAEKRAYLHAFNIGSKAYRKQIEMLLKRKDRYERAIRKKKIA